MALSHSGRNYILRRKLRYNRASLEETAEMAASILGLSLLFRFDIV